MNRHDIKIDGSRTWLDRYGYDDCVYLSAGKYVSHDRTGYKRFKTLAELNDYFARYAQTAGKNILLQFHE